MPRLALAAVLIALPVLGPAAEPASAASKPASSAPASPARPDYKRLAKLMVTSKWVSAVKEKGDAVAPGTVSCVFTLDAQGKLIKFSVTKNTSKKRPRRPSC